MLSYCPHVHNLKCSQSDRTEEFYRQLQEAMLCNKPTYLLTSGQCPVSKYECMKLREFCEKQQRQNQHVR